MTPTAAYKQSLLDRGFDPEKNGVLFLCNDCADEKEKEKRVQEEAQRRKEEERLERERLRREALERAAERAEKIVRALISFMPLG